MVQEVVSRVLDSFTPISLGEMDGVRLMNRTDTKYLMREEKLPDLLEQLKQHYYVQEIAGSKLATYQTMYLDTVDYEMFLIHHNDRAQREKVRIREYIDTKQVFLEVKKKNSKGRTNKQRIPITNYVSAIRNGAAQFISTTSGYTVDALSPHLETLYDRITLVNHSMTERITIDLNIRFRNVRTGLVSDIQNLAIIELKQERFATSYLSMVMNRLRILPMRISKYCIGAIATNPQLKHNRFKSKMMRINKIINDKHNRNE